MESPSVLAMPKSISLTTPAWLMCMFSGLMSRWMIFCEWMYSSARATCRAIFSLLVQIAGVAVLDGVAQILAAQKLHHHEGAMLVVFAEIVNAEDVVVGDVAGHARFGQKARLGFGILAAGLGEDLDRHGAADHGVARAVDVRHAAAQELLQLVLADARGKLHLGLGHLRHAAQTGEVALVENRRVGRDVEASQ